jgi:hypothetical protein
MQKYRIESGENLDHADKLADAKYLAGVMILNTDASLSDAQVRVIRQLGKPARWSAHLDSEGAVTLRPLACDATDIDITAAIFESRRANALAGLIDREAARREKRDRDRDADRRRRSRKYGKGVARAVICVTTAPPRWFDSVQEAADWLGVKRQSLDHALNKPGEGGRQRKCMRMTFAYADHCAPEIVAAAKAARGNSEQSEGSPSQRQCV